MRKLSINIFFAAGVTILLVLSGCASGIINSQNTPIKNSSQQKTIDGNQDGAITCYIGGVPYTQKISYTSGVQLKELFTELAMANARDSDSSETQCLQQQILLYVEQQGLLPKGISADKIFTRLETLRQNIVLQQFQDSSRLDAGASHQFFCNFVSWGEGSAFPIIILPRFIPIIMSPIPRLFVGWKTLFGVTSCGGLVSRTGFIASGPQQGLALGFWGIGFSIFLPPVMAYGMFGYALYAKVTAAEMEYWPPNNAPEITATYPLDGSMYIPLSTTELSFHLGDLDGDLMSYSVTTNPDVGGGNGNLKPDGTYTVPISGLKSNTEYSWSVTASDGKDTVEKEFTFTTEPVAPIISEVHPINGDRYVAITQAYLSFHLRDPQSDLMDYTVETSPFIGSGSGSGVSEGDISIPISGLDYLMEYHWFVNATDGEHLTSESYWFRTGPMMVFDPFEEGWGYRKMITINHTQVADDLYSFPVLLSVTDMDLRDKAQNDGDDILFMDGTGVATRLYHEIEEFNGATGQLVAWVNVTSLRSTVDTTLYMYYGNTGSGNQQCSEKTWDAHYKMVQHMSDALLDSTSNNHDGSKYHTPEQTIGKIGYAEDFESSDQDGVDISGGNIVPCSSTATEITIEAWVKYETTSNHAKITAQLDDGEVNFGISDGHPDCITFVTKDTGGTYKVAWSNPVTTGTWYYVYGTWKKNDYNKAAVNDVFGTNITNNNLQLYDKNMYQTIGYERSDASTYRFFNDGIIDEVRYSDVVRDAGWLSTCFTNQNNPSSFLMIGPEESPPIK